MSGTFQTGVNLFNAGKNGLQNGIGGAALDAQGSIDSAALTNLQSSLTAQTNAANDGQTAAALSQMYNTAEDEAREAAAKAQVNFAHTVTEDLKSQQ